MELVSGEEITKLLDTIISVSIKDAWTVDYVTYPFKDMHGKEKETLENEAKMKLASRDEALQKAKEIKAKLKI